MKSKTVWGDFETSRWEFQDNKKNPEGDSESLAEAILGNPEIKKPEKKIDETKETSEQPNEQSEKEEILNAVVRDYIDGNLDESELVEVLNAIKEQ